MLAHLQMRDVQNEHLTRFVEPALIPPTSVSSQSTVPVEPPGKGDKGMSGDLGPALSPP